MKPTFSASLAALSLILAQQTQAFWTSSIECPPYPSQVASDVRVNIEAAAGRIVSLKAIEAAAEFQRGLRDLWSNAKELDRLVLRATALAATCQMLRSSKIPDAQKLETWERINAQVLQLRNPEPESGVTSTNVSPSSATRESRARITANRSTASGMPIAAPVSGVRVELFQRVARDTTTTRTYREERLSTENRIDCFFRSTVRESVELRIPPASRVRSHKAEWIVQGREGLRATADSRIDDKTLRGFGTIDLSNLPGRESIDCGYARLHLSAEIEQEVVTPLPAERVYLGGQSIKGRTRIAIGADAFKNLSVRVVENPATSSEVDFPSDASITRPMFLSLDNYGLLAYIDRQDLVLFAFPIK